MATQGAVRQRKAGQKDQTAPSARVARGKEQQQQQPSSFLTLVRIGFYALLACVGIIMFQFPQVAKDLVGSWLGVPDGRDQQLPGTGKYVGFEADVEKQAAIVEAFKHAWSAYERDAMGKDEYHPLSRNGSYLVAAGGIGYTVVDALDTMLIMGLDDEYQRARAWVETELDFDRDGNFNTFETTIRVLGGLLAAYHLSGEDKLYLDKAVELADRMIPVFAPSGLPLSMINLARREGVPDRDNNGLVSTAEATTLQLEFRYLSALTDEDIYWKKAEKVMAVARANRMEPGLVSIYMNVADGRFVNGPIRLGSRGDSYYEYLLKQYLQTDMKEEVYRDMYVDAMSAVNEHLVKRGMYAGLTYTSEIIPERDGSGGVSWRLTPKQDFLVCFLGGALMLGATRVHSLSDHVSVPPRASELTPEGVRDWKTGVGLVETCMATHDTQTGLPPEIAHFRIASDKLENTALGNVPRDWYIKGAKPGAPAPYDARYMLRPETVESLFYAFRLTGSQRYRDYGWSIFQAIQKHCRVPSGGYATVINVDDLPAEQEDKMETFFMSETLKYLYLLFSDDQTIPLSDYVFNTEAHPLPIFQPTIRTGFS